jgi:hypothetical protein
MEQRTALSVADELMAEAERSRIRQTSGPHFDWVSLYAIRGQQSRQSLQVEIIGKAIAQIIKKIGGAHYVGDRVEGIEHGESTGRVAGIKYGK